MTIILSLFFLANGADNKFSIYINYKEALNSLTFGYLFFSNILIIGMDWVMFMGIDISQGTFFFSNDYLATHPQLYNFLFIPQAWTLSLELIFYFIAPFLVKRKLRFLIILIFLSLILRAYLYSIGLHREPWTNRFFPTELVFFLFGILSFKVYKRIEYKKSLFISKMVFLILIIFTIFYSFISQSPGKYFNIMQWGYYAMLLAAIPLIFQLTKKNVIDKILGMFSYPVYISHMFIIIILIHMGQNQSQHFALLTVILTLIISTLLIIFIEQPVNYYRQNRLKLTIPKLRK